MKRICGYLYTLLFPIKKRTKFMQLIYLYTSTNQKSKLNKAKMENFKAGSIPCLITFPIISAFIDLFKLLFGLEYIGLMAIICWISIDKLESVIHQVILNRKIKSVGVGF